MADKVSQSLVARWRNVKCKNATYHCNMAECCNANCVQWLKCTPVCSCVMQCTVFCTIILQGIATLQCSVSALSTEEFSHYAALTHCVGRGPFLLCDHDDDDGDYDADDLHCCESSSSSCNCDW